MTQFAIFSTLLIVVVGAFLLPPLWLGLRGPQVKADRKAANLAIFRDQQHELDREKVEGELAEADYDQATRELRRRLLEEIDPAAEQEAATPGNRSPSRKMAIAVLLLIPVLSLVGYGMLGNPQALMPEQRVAPQAMTPEQINEMVARLAEKMKANPDDLQGWVMLARSYKTMGRYEDAVAAYVKAEKLVNQDPDLLSSYAEALAMARGKGLAGEPKQLLDKALKLDPKHPRSLFLAGAAAMETGDRKQAVAYWEALLPQVEPGSEIDTMLRKGIEKMKQGQ